MSTRALLELELLSWWAVTWPAATRGLLELLPWLATLVVVGHGLGSTDLAALSLVETWGYSFMVISWYSVSATLSTLVSQAHGAGNVAAARGWLAIGVVACVGMSAGVAGAWACTVPALTAAGFDPELVRRGARFLVPAIPALMLQAVTVPLAVFLTSIQVAWLPAVLQLSSCALDIGLTYGLVLGRSDMGLAGAAVAWNCSAALSALQYACALRWAMGRELTFGGGAKPAPEGEPAGEERDGDRDGAVAPLLEDDGLAHSPLPTPASADGPPPAAGAPPRGLDPAGFVASRRRWRAFAALAGPNALSAALDTLQYTIISLLAASLGAPQIAAHNSMLCVLDVAHTVSTGMSEATAVRVGYHLGRRDVRGAQRAAAVAFAGALLWGCVAAGAGLALGGAVGRVFSSDPAVLDCVRSIAPFLWGGYAFLCLGYQVVGVLEGSGRASAQAAVFLAGPWCVAVPSAFAVAHLTAWGLPGLWACMMGGYAAAMAAGAALVLTSDWEALADAAAAGE